MEKMTLIEAILASKEASTMHCSDCGHCVAVG